MTPWDCQAQRIYDANGIFPALDANTGGGQNRQAVVYEPMSLKEENWAEADAKSALRAGASKSSHAVVYENHQHGGYRIGCGTLRANGGDYGGGSENLVVEQTRRYIVRRLTPTECARLQGFPDWWTDGVPGSDTAKYKMWGNGMALPCMLAVLSGVSASEKANRRTCPTCAHHLGAEQCRINSEGECREGGGYELWEGKNA